MSSPQNGTSGAETAATTPAPQPRERRTTPWVLIALLAVGAVAAFSWYDTRSRIGATQEELARRLRDLENGSRDVRTLARRSEELVQELQSKVSQFDARVTEYQSQQVALEALYQELSRNRDEWQLAEVEQVLAIAQQQLQLSGNVRAALLALELAESRLARADRPQFLPVRRALARDIERLKATPVLDLPGLSLRLDRLIAAVDTMPLAFEERAERDAAGRVPVQASDSALGRLGAEIWGELKQLVIVRRVDGPDAPLLPPSQAYFLRENLRLRLLNARLALLTRDEAGFREDLRAAQAWIRRYAEPRSKQSAEMLGQLRQFDTASLSFEPPSISESLDAVRGFKSRREKETLMRGLLWLIAVFAAAVAVVIFGRASASYVLLVYPPYRIELSLLFFCGLLAAGFAVLYFCFRMLSHTLALPAHVRAWRARRRREAAQAAFAAALLALYEGRYARAEKEAATAFEYGPTPGLAALIAARAAHELRNFARRDAWLERAAAGGEPMQAACLVTKASLALEEHDYEGARRSLRALRDAGRRHIASLRMLLRAERGLGNHEEVLRLARLLAKRDAIAPAAAEEYKLRAYIELLSRAAQDRLRLETAWRDIPVADQVQPRVALAAARHAGALGAVALARQILEQALGEEWSPQLVAAYGELPMPGGEERAQEARLRIERAEKWLLQRPGDPQLLATLGSLCTHAELWGKAEACLEASLSFEESRSAHLALARLFERLGRGAEAQRHFRRAAEVMV